VIAEILEQATRLWWWIRFVAAPATNDWILNNKDVLQTVAAFVGAFVAPFAWWAARQSARAARISAETARMTERAYVNLSHEPPGLRVEYRRLPLEQRSPGTEYQWEVSASLRVTNNGRTPAEINANAAAVWTGAELPREPPYPVASPETFSLAAGDYYVIPYKDKFEDAEWNEVWNGARKAWLIAYVDYTDTFQHRHRAGYTRLYSRPDIENNLVFALTAGYNYDRELPPA
jgi:hypothetical protein